MDVSIVDVGFLVGLLVVGDADGGMVGVITSVSVSFFELSDDVLLLLLSVSSIIVVDGGGVSSI